MHSLELNKIYTVAEYFAMEESGEIRHEYVNGNLIEMSGASREHHFICQKIFLTLLSLVKPLGYVVFMENMKVKVTEENRYYYPDIFVTKERQTEENKYVQFEPELIAEVLSEATRVKDMTDKFIQYRKIPSLKYYLLVEPEKTLILVNYKNDSGDWEMNSYTRMEEIIDLPGLGITFGLDKIYQ